MVPCMPLCTNDIALPLLVYSDSYMKRVLLYKQSPKKTNKKIALVETN